MILIGGEVTLDSGAQLDTRRPIEGDEWDFTLREAVGGSEAFWQRAKDLTDIILAQNSSDESWAFAWVGKTIRQPRADGTSKRVRTVDYLDDADQLMDASLRMQGTAKIDARNLKRPYRILPYYLRFFDLVTSSSPTVFVGAFQTTYEDGADIIGLRPLTDVLTFWPESTLVLPHTPLVEKKVRELLQWHRKGALPPERDEFGPVGPTELVHPQQYRSFVSAYQATEELRGAKPFIIEHDLRVTFWSDEATIKDPADLEAAFTFVQSRYDLEIGLWDLARDPLLRETLLEPGSQPVAHKSAVPLPIELKESAQERTAHREAADLAEREDRERLHSVLWPKLEPRGWMVSPTKVVGSEYWLPMGPWIETPYPGLEEVPIAYFALEILKRQATLSLTGWADETLANGVIGLKEDHADDIEGLTGRPLETDEEFGPIGPICRFSQGGWAESFENWEQDLRTIQAVIDLLTPPVRSLVETAMKRREKELQSDRSQGESGPGASLTSRKKRGLLDRMLGRN